jgi:hypothetical protein
MQFLASHPGCFTSSRTAAPGAGRGRQEAGPGDLSPGRRELAELRQAHLLEVATGFRSGSSLHPRPGEPKPEYDPGATTLTQRRRAKAAELAALDTEQARLPGLDHVGYRTLIRWENGRRRAGLVGCADDRWLRESGGHPSVTEQIREAMLMVREQTQHRSRVTMKTRHVLVCQYMRETFGGEAGFPSYRTFCRVWREWFGPGGARPRNDGSDGLPAKAGHVVVSRPGQVVALDTTVLPVKVREGMFGDPVSVHLTLALDVYTHSLVAFRLTLVSDTSVDIAMLLRDVMMPLPMREGWGPEMAWPYPGIRPRSSPSSPATSRPGCRSSPRRPSPPITGRSTKATCSAKRRESWAATSSPPARCAPRTNLGLHTAPLRSDSWLGGVHAGRTVSCRRPWWRAGGLGPGGL